MDVGRVRKEVRPVRIQREAVRVCVAWDVACAARIPVLKSSAPSVCVLLIDDIRARHFGSISGSVVFNKRNSSQ